MISALDSASGLPISSVITQRELVGVAVIASNARRRISPRSRGGCTAHSSCTAQAASSAALASSGVASATLASVSPVDGSSTSSVAPPVGVAPLAADEQLRRDRVDRGPLLGCAHAATVSVPSSSEMDTSSE